MAVTKRDETAHSEDRHGGAVRSWTTPEQHILRGILRGLIVRQEALSMPYDIGGGPSETDSSESY